MDRWIRGMQEMLGVLLGQPTSPLEFWIILLVTFLMLSWAFGKTAKAAQAADMGPVLSMLVTALAIGAMLVGMQSLRVYVLPSLGSTGHHTLLLAGAFVSSWLVVVVVMRIIQKASLAASSISWVVGMLAATFMVTVISTVFGVVHKGEQDLENTKSRTQEMDQFLKDNK